MKTDLVLAGGGAKGIFELGFVKVLWDHGYRFNSVIGTSAGGLNACLIGLGKIDELEDIWLNVKPEEVYKKVGTLKVAWRLLRGSTGLYDNTPLYELIKKTLNNLTSPSRVGVVNMRTGRFHLAPANPKNTYITANIPIIWDLVEDYWADGGLREQTPLKYAIDNNPDRIIVVLTAPLESGNDSWDWKKKKGIERFLSVIQRVIGIMGNEIYKNDIEGIRTINNLVKQAEDQGFVLKHESGSPYKYIDLHVIEPSVDLGETLDFSKKTMSWRYEYGYQAGIKFVESNPL